MARNLPSLKRRAGAGLLTIDGQGRTSPQEKAAQKAGKASCAALSTRRERQAPSPQRTGNHIIQKPVALADGHPAIGNDGLAGNIA